MSDRVDIPDLGKKIALVLRSGKKPIQTERELMQRLKIGKDYWSRIKSGTRVLNEVTFVKMCALLQIEQRVWFHPLLDFGKNLDLSRWEISVITNTPLPGMDFSSRIKDEETVGQLFGLLEGYWESFYFSVSKLDKIVISRDLFIVRHVNEDGFIECEIQDGYFRYKGLCFPIQNHLYIILEKVNLFNEIIVYATNLPERQPPRLFGIILCLSGGVDEMHSFPCAAKVAFRYLGKAEEIRREHEMASIEDVELLLIERVPGYLDPQDRTLDPDTSAIVESIRNILDATAVPSALRMSK